MEIAWKWCHYLWKWCRTIEKGVMYTILIEVNCAFGQLLRDDDIFRHINIWGINLPRPLKTPFNTLIILGKCILGKPPPEVSLLMRWHLFYCSSDLKARIPFFTRVSKQTLLFCLLLAWDLFPHWLSPEKVPAAPADNFKSHRRRCWCVPRKNLNCWCICTNLLIYFYPLFQFFAEANPI